MSNKMISCSSCRFCEYVNEHKDIFKNKVLTRKVHNIISKNPDIFKDYTTYEELYNEHLNNRNMKEKEYRESKKNDEEFMAKWRSKKLIWFHENKGKVSEQRKLKREGEKQQCNNQ